MSNPLDELRHNLQILAENDVDMLIEKGRHYGDSWKKRGGPGAYMVMARKMDRLENIAKKANYDIFAALAKKLDGDEPLLDTIRDLRGYLYLIEEEYLARQRGGGERRPDEEAVLFTVDGTVNYEQQMLRNTINTVMGCTPGQFTGVRNPDHMRINVDIRTFCALDTGPGGWAEAIKREGIANDKPVRTVEMLAAQPPPDVDTVRARLTAANRMNATGVGQNAPIVHTMPDGSPVECSATNEDDGSAAPPASALHPA